jgi:acyl dehydratase
MRSAADMPLFFEDYEALEIGHTWRTSSRTITQAEVNNFAAATGDDNPIHVDLDYAKASNYGGPIVHGYLTISMAAGLVYQLGLDEVASHAILSTNWTFARPVPCGDAIHVVLTLLSQRSSKSQPKFGIITRRYTVLNEREETVADGEVAMLILRRGQTANDHSTSMRAGLCKGVES